jgi:hypothetical protein
MALLSSEPDSYRDAVRVDLILDISGENEEGNASKVVLDCPLVEEAFNTRMYNDNQYEGARQYKDKVRRNYFKFHYP